MSYVSISRSRIEIASWVAGLHLFKAQIFNSSREGTCDLQQLLCFKPQQIPSEMTETHSNSTLFAMERSCTVALETIGNLYVIIYIYISYT